MHLGKIPGGGYTAPKSSPKIPPADYDLEEVTVTAKRLPVPASAPVDEGPLEEILVTARKIPWYAWAAVGFAGAVLIARK
jgi:hypothetical protein